MNPQAALTYLLPEIVLCGMAVLLLFVGMAARTAGRNLAPLLALGGLAAYLAAALWVNDQASLPVVALDCDALTGYVRLAVALVGGLIVLVNWHVPADSERPEFFALMLFAFAGISLVAAADDLLLLFLALELVSVPTYILIGLSGNGSAAQEATGKYFFLGAFAAAITLYGFSFLYGAAGTTAMGGASGGADGVAAALRSAGPQSLAMIGLLLSIVGLLFKIAAAPLHFYVADVYQGAASPVSGLLGFVPKLAGFVALARLLDLTGWHFDDTLFGALWIIAVATMIAGNTLALMQRGNVKRVLAYSSVAHSGYMLVALLAGPSVAGGAASPLGNGVAAVLFYMVIYGIMNLGAFAVLAYLRDGRSGEPVQTFDELAAAARGQPVAAIALALCSIGLMGLPPTAGMMGKVYVFSSALAALPEGAPHREAFIWLVIIGVFNAAVGAAYYLRIASACVMGSREPQAPPLAAPTACRALYAGLLICAAFVVYGFIKPAPLMAEAQFAARAMNSTAPVPARQPAPPAQPTGAPAMTAVPMQ